ncbi:transposable element Tc1 transposase [Trichonephila clavipes]|nr:transposable element Tc1 transposase [Trichonephila clavipes]
MTLADCRRPLFAFRMIYRSSHAVVILGRPPPTFITVLTVVWNTFQARNDTFVNSERCSYTGDGTPLLQLSNHSSTCEVVQEDFGKRNMPVKRAKRHFSQLSEFERGLIIKMKTAGWSTRRVAGQVDRSKCAVRNCWEQWTREGSHVRKTGSGATRKTTRRDDRMIVQQALVDPTVTRSTMRADVGVAIVPQTISRHLAQANLKSKHPFRALPITPENRQLRLQWCQARSMWNDWQKVVFRDESRFVWGQMITVYGCGGTLTLPSPTRSPDLSPVLHVWDQLKQQMPSCHSVHDLELDVQDLCAHLPQDNIRCLINSMPDRVGVCIAAGGGQTRY